MAISLINIKYQLAQIIHKKNFIHGILYTVFSFINNGINFILILILAKYLTPFDYGKLNLFTTFVTLLNIIISLSTTSYISISFFKKSQDVLRQIIFIVLIVTTITLMTLSCGLFVVPELFEKSIGIQLKYLWLGLWISYFQVFNSINLDIWRLEEKPIYYGLYSVSFAILNFIITFWLITGLDWGWEGRVYASWIIGIIYFFISIIFLLKRHYLKISKPKFLYLKETLIYSIPLIPHSISFWLKQGVDRYIINYFYDSTAVGYFSFAMNLAAVIGMVGTAFNATNSIYIFKKLNEGYERVKDNLQKQTKMMILFFFIITICIGLFAFFLITWGLPKYSNSIRYIVPLCLTGFFQCLYLLWVNYLFFYQKTHILMYITFSTAILQIMISIWLTRYDILYTAYVSLLIMILTVVLVRLYSEKTLRFNS